MDRIDLADPVFLDNFDNEFPVITEADRFDEPLVNPDRQTT